MVLEIRKGTPPEQVRLLIKQYEEQRRQAQPQKSMRKRYGSLPNVFGNPVEYQKQLRSEWD